MFTISVRCRLDLRLQARDGNALDNDVPPLGNCTVTLDIGVPALGNCTVPSDAESSTTEFVDRQFPDLQLLSPTSDLENGQSSVSAILENRQSSVSVLWVDWRRFALLSGVETEGGCARPTSAMGWDLYMGPSVVDL